MEFFDGWHGCLPAGVKLKAGGTERFESAGIHNFWVRLRVVLRHDWRQFLVGCIGLNLKFPGVSNCG